MRLTLIKNGQVKDITNYSGSYSRSDNMDSLGQEFIFSLAQNPNDKLFPSVTPTVGDGIKFENENKVVFAGIVITEEWEGKTTRTYTAYDFGFYLGKSQVKKQFKKMDADAAIKKLCSEMGIPVGTIASMPTKISKIYSGETLSDVIKDIVEQVEADNGKEYRMELSLENKLDIVEWKNLTVSPSFQSAANIAPFNPVKYPGNISGKNSIEEMKNYIIVNSQTEKETSVQSVAKDMESIKKYGLLQQVEDGSDKNEAQGRNAAKNRLKELNKVTSTCTVELLGSDVVRSGRIIALDLPECNLKGDYLVKNCAHSYNPFHTMRIEVVSIG